MWWMQACGMPQELGRVQNGHLTDRSSFLLRSIRLVACHWRSADCVTHSQHFRCKQKKKLKWKTCSFVNHFYAEDVMTSSVFSLIGWHTTSFPFIFIEDKVLLHADMLINHKSFVSQARLCFRSHRLSILERVFSFFRFARCTMINGSVCNDKTCSAHLAIFESHFPRWPPLPPPLPPYGFLSFSFYIIIHCIASRFHGLMFQFFYRRQYGINSCQATCHTNTMVLGAERTMWIKHTNRLAMRCRRTVHSLFTRWHVAKHFHFTNMHSHGSDNNIANAIERHEECVASQFVPMRCLLRVVSSICVRIFQRIEFDEEAKEWQKEKKSALIYCNRRKRMTPCSQWHSPVYPVVMGIKQQKRRSLRSPHWRHSGSIFVSNTLASNAQQQTQKENSDKLFDGNAPERQSSILQSSCRAHPCNKLCRATSASTEMQELCVIHLIKMHISHSHRKLSTISKCRTEPHFYAQCSCQLV